MLAQLAPDPLRTPYIVGEALLVVAVLRLAVTPETVRRHPGAGYRIQRVVVPRRSRSAFAAAAVAAAVTFTIFGVFGALVPSILTGTLHQHSHVLAGAVAALVFLASAVAQLSAGCGRPVSPRTATVTATSGLAVLAIATWTATLPLFAFGAVLTGAGAGLVFKALLAVVVDLGPPDQRGEVLAAFFLTAYLGLALPVLTLGLLDELISTSVLMTVFAGVVGLGLIAAVRALPAPHGQAADAS